MSMPLGHSGVCFKDNFTLAAITAAEKHTLLLDSTKHIDRVNEVSNGIFIEL